MILLLALTVAALGSVLYNGFVDFDDPEYVTGNEAVAGGITREGIAWAFTSTWSANWHPVTWLSHMLDVRLFGMNPRGHHLTSLLLHLANVAVLFLVLRAMTGVIGPALLVAALFAVHPLHVESVAWVAERKDVLSTFFWILAMAAYLAYARRPGLARYLLVAMLTCLGLLSKPMVVTLPFVLLLLDFWPLGRLLPGAGFGRRLLALAGEKAPLLALSAVSSVVTIVAQRRSGALESGEGFPLAVRLVNALDSVAAYLAGTVWPTGLAVYYPHPRSFPPVAQVAGAAFLVAACTVAALAWSRRRPYLAVGWLWFLGTLVPVLGLVQVGQQAMADRYTYVPLIGIFVALSWWITTGLGRVKAGRVAALVVSAVAVAALGLAARTQVSVWRDTGTLFEHAIAVTSRNWLAHNNLGVAFYDAGRLEEAAAHYREALRFEPLYPAGHNNLGNALLGQGNWVEAEAHFREAIRLDPARATAYNSLGVVHLRRGDFAAAVPLFREATRLKPKYGDARYNLAFSLEMLGEYAAAAAEYAETVRIVPGDRQARERLDYLSGRSGSRLP